MVNNNGGYVTMSDPLHKYVLTSCHVPGTEIGRHPAKNGKINKI